MKIKKILVPMDGSANSFGGLNLAISIAGPAGAAITLVHSIHEHGHTEFKSVDHSTDMAEHESVRKFIEKAEKLLEKSGVAFRSKVVHGNTGYNILKLAHSKSEKFDMVVIGSRGHSSIKKMFFGSTSNHVIHSSKIPVLVVK